MILGTPVIAITVLLVALERFAHVGIFDPKYGGDPVLFQHLFWFYSHPAVYIMVLPGMGVISELITTFSRKTFSATNLWRVRASPSQSLAFSCGATTCSCRANRFTPG
jgi:heme/copper-type cytochrome/quinol oxidase subunit 1